MDYINKKFNELRLLASLKKRNSTASVILKLDSPNEDLDIISLPSCSKSDEEHSNESNNSIGNSISSLIGQKVFVKRSTRFRYQDAVRSASYLKSEFVLHALQWHNILRSHHAVPPLMLSLDLCQKAQFWANHLSHTDTFYHRYDSDIGQNLLSKWTYYSDFDPSAEEIVKYWYNYIDMYDFNLEPNVLHTQANHFTQLIWKNSKYFGIGKARTRNGKMIVVANYMPSGNVSGVFNDNVLPPIFSDIDINRSTGIRCKLIEKNYRHKYIHSKRLNPLKNSLSTISGSRID